MITILLLCCALIFAVEAAYFFTHQTKMYFAAPLRHPNALKKAGQIWGTTMTVLTIGTLVAAFTVNITLVFIILVLGCLAQLLLALTVSTLLLK